MTVLTGYLANVTPKPQTDVTQQHVFTTALQSRVKVWSGSSTFNILDTWNAFASTLNGGLLTENLPISVTFETKISTRLTGFFEDYYNRIHFIPGKTIDVGVLAGDVTETITVWNAYRDAKLLQSITPLNASGINLTEPSFPGPAPAVFPPLSFFDYVWEVTTDGPASISATYEFDFPSPEPGLTPSQDPIVTVLGLRSFLWSFPPTWSEAMIERFEYLTDVFLSYNGTEQRARLRGLPRREFEYAASAPGDPNLTTAEAQQIMDSLIWAGQTRKFVFPIWTDCIVTTQDHAIGTTVFPYDSTDLDFHVGGLAVLFHDVKTTEVLNVTSIAGGNITVSPGTKKAWVAGDKLYPARLARMETSQDVSHPTDELRLGNFLFRVVDDTSETPTPVDETVLHQGSPVLQYTPEWGNDRDFIYQSKAFTIDYDTGPYSVDDQVGSPLQLMKFRWVLGSRSEITKLKQLLAARAGRLKRIWVPTWTNDLEVITNIASTDTSISIRDINYRNTYLNTPGRRDIQVLSTDGSRVTATISGAVKGAGNTEVLQLSGAFGATINVDDIEKTSFLLACRLDTDVIEYSWEARNVVVCEVNFRLIPSES